MARRSLTGLSGLVALAATVAAPTVGADDWPRYRGPRGDGVSTETGLVEQLPEAGLPELWRTELGTGFSGVSVADGRAFTLFGRDGHELAVALDAASGEELWQFRLDEDRRDPMGGGPRSTPTVDGDTVYVLGARGKLAALAVADGSERWQVDLVTRLGARVPHWGISTSPAVAGELLLLELGGREGFALAALGKRDGEVRWHSGDDRPGYSSPLVVTIGGVEQALFFTGQALVSVAPESGELYWRHRWPTAYDVNVAMPVFAPPDRIFISSSYDVGGALVRVERTASGFRVHEVWRNRQMKNHFNTSVLVDGFLYGFDNATLKCLDLATGEERWSQRGFSKGSLLSADGHLIVLGERGLLALVEATPEAYREKGRFEVLRGKTWTVPTLADGRLYLRSEQELVALDLRSTT